MRKKKQEKDLKEKVDYPRLPIEKAAKLTEQVVKDYGGFISYKELSKIGGAGGKTMGGTFGSITKSLKLYGLMERHGLQEMKVTGDGKKLAEIEDEDKKKAFLFNLSLKIPIISELYKRYKGSVPKKIKSIADYLSTVKNLEKREAGRLANLYIKNHDYFGEVDLGKLEEIGEEIEPEPSEIQVSQINEDKILLLKLKYAFHPPGERTKDDILDKVLKKFRGSGDAGIESLIEGIQKNKEDKKMRETLLNLLLSSFEKKYPFLKTLDEEERHIEAKKEK